MATEDLSANAPEPRLIELSPDECLGLLAVNDLGRVAVIDTRGPAVFPVSYELRVVDQRTAIVFRTRSGGEIDHRGRAVCFEIDGLDAGHDGGWSVLVRGVLESIEPDSGLDPALLLPDDRDAWRAILPTEISGRRLLAQPFRWTFDPHGYL